MTDMLIKIRDSMDSLSAAEKTVGEYIVENPEETVTLPISELSNRSNVSRSTWVRFSKSIGYTGFKQLKHEIFRQMNNAAPTASTLISFTDVTNHDSCEEACLYIKSNAVNSLEQTYKILDYKSLDTVAELILNTGKVCIFGIGASSLVARDFYTKLLRIGLPVIYTSDFHTAITAISAMNKGDVAVFFSYSGKTNEIIELASLAKDIGCTVVAITKFGRSELAKLADFSLYTAAFEAEMRIAAMSSRIAQLFMVDALFISITTKGFRWIKGKLMESYTQTKKHKLTGD
jgi:DNA-binding MurR/RpiR family transcriptional regulator